MRVLFVAKDDSLGEYLRGQGHEAKTVFTNDIALRAAREFKAEAVVYCTNALKLEGHDKIIQELQGAGFRVVLAAEKGDPVVQFAAALGVADLLTFPLDPASVLHRLENPATREEAADLVRRLAQPEQEKPETPKKGFNLNLKLPGFKRRKEKPAEEAPPEGAETETTREKKRAPAAAPGPEKPAQPERLVQPEREERLGTPPAPSGTRPAPNVGETGETTLTPPGPKIGKDSDVYRDALTGCYTRRYLSERLALSGPYSVVFIDLDSFKPVNDILGHEAGDRVLAAFGKMLTDHLKGRDLAVRWGGDEFALVLPDTSPKAAEKVVENLRRAWEKAAPDTGNLKVGFSAGTSCGKGTDGLPEAIREADKAMYTAKNRAKAAAWPPGRSAPGPAPYYVAPAPYAPPAPKESPLQLVWQTITGAFNVLAVMLLVSAGIWAVNFSLQMMGVNSPALNKIAALVVGFWKMVWTGIFG
ncbi:MAG: diguanylate cyclase [Desulfotomaculales bacterium]